ncbi:MAG: hypothetical protein AAGE52_00885 [Myxococcota bacterium]
MSDELQLLRQLPVHDVSASRADRIRVLAHRNLRRPSKTESVLLTLVCAAHLLWALQGVAGILLR